MTNSDNMAQHLEEAGIIAIFRKLPQAVIAPLAESLVEAGIRAIELTVESKGAYEAMRELRQRYGEELMIGAGTIMEQSEVEQAVEAGANFLLSPHFDASLVSAANVLKVPMIPGVATATEVVQAQRTGAKILKLFPAAPLGPAYLKDLLGPFQGRHFIPTGGINTDNAADFIRAGALALGMGSSLASAAEIEREDWATVQQRVRNALEQVSAARHN